MLCLDLLRLINAYPRKSLKKFTNKDAASFRPHQPEMNLKMHQNMTPLLGAETEDLVSDVQDEASTRSRLLVFRRISGELNSARDILKLSKHGIKLRMII